MCLCFLLSVFSILLLRASSCRDSSLWWNQFIQAKKKFPGPTQAPSRLWRKSLNVLKCSPSIKVPLARSTFSQPPLGRKSPLCWHPAPEKKTFPRPNRGSTIHHYERNPYVYKLRSDKNVLPDWGSLHRVMSRQVTSDHVTSRRWRQTLTFVFGHAVQR